MIVFKNGLIIKKRGKYMEKKESKLNIYRTKKMFDFTKLADNEPELFDELCEDYPLDNQILMIEIDDGNKQRKSK